MSWPLNGGPDPNYVSKSWEPILQVVLFYYQKKNTPSKTNMESENHPFEKETHLNQTCIF